MDIPIWLPIALFVIVFPLMWCGILWLLALMSGWRTLAARFPAPDEIRGTAMRWSSARIGNRTVPVNFNSIITMHLSPQGLRLACAMPALGAFKPIFVPWRDVLEALPRRVLFGNATRLSVRDWNGVIELRGNAGEMALAHWQEHQASR